MDADELSRKMTEYQAGDAAAFDVLFRELSPRIYGYLVQSTRDRTLADDLLQEVFLNVHRARATWRPGSPVLPWLFAIARHVAASRARGAGRRARREEPREDLESLPVAADATGAGRASDDPRLDELETALSELPEAQRQVVTMLKVSGMSLKEIAATTGATVGAVKLRAHRGYEALRKRLGAPAKKKGEAA